MNKYLDYYILNVHYLEFNRVLVLEKLTSRQIYSNYHVPLPTVQVQINLERLLSQVQLHAKLRSQQPTLGNYSMNLSENQMKHH